MTFLETKYRKEISSKWLLRITILLSVFTFAGNSGYSKSLNKSNVQTEIVCKLYLKTTKRTVSFRNKLPTKQTENLNFIFNNCWTLPLITYERQTKVRFENINKLHFLSYKAGLFLTIKTIHQNSDGDNFISIKG